MCALLNNPFGPRSYDIHHNEVGKEIRLLATSLASSRKKCNPETLVQPIMHNTAKSTVESFDFSEQPRIEAENLRMSMHANMDVSDFGRHPDINLLPNRLPLISNLRDKLKFN